MSELHLAAYLTPVYNGERFLAETMECVQQSDYRNLVHVILDNASTDRTPEIIASFKGRRVPILVYRNEKTLTMVENFNAIVEHIPAGVEFVRFLCADDLVAPSALSKMVAVAKRDERVSLVGCYCDIEGNTGPELGRDQSVFAGSGIVRSYLRRELMVLSGTHFLYRCRDLIRAIPNFDRALRARADGDLAIRVALLGSFGFVHEVLAEFRVHGESHTARIAETHGDLLYEWLVLLDRYGPKVLDPAEYAECRTRYRRYFLRRSFLPLIREGNLEYFSLQMKRLADLNDRADLLDFADAMGEWLYFTLTGQRGRVGAPS